MAACSNDMEQPAAVQTASGYSGEGIPFSATIGVGSATTRALTEDTGNGTILSTWAKGEQVALIHNGVVDVMTIQNDPDQTTGSVTITGTLTGNPKDGDDVTVVFPASAVDMDNKAVKTALLATQDGTLATIATSLNLRQSKDAKLKVGERTSTLNGTVTLANQIAIVKFSLSDGTAPLATKSLVIKDGSDNVLTTVTAASEMSDLYVALAPASDAVFNFNATVGEFSWLYSKTGVTLEAGKYYQSPITMTISKKAGEISYATSSVSKTFGDDSFTNALSKTGDGTVTYSSSNTAVAEVDSETGEVTIKGDGNATIKATVTDGPTYTYAKTEASYTLSVAAATMTVTAAGYTGTYDGSAHGITVTAPEGATIQYGTAEGTCDKDASPAYTNAGTYTVYYEVTKKNYTTVTGSATVKIYKAAGSIYYATASVDKVTTDAAFTNELTKVGDGAVTYLSDNQSVATVSSTGEVTIVGVGEANITATVADSDTYTYATNSATYKVTVTAAPSLINNPGGYAEGGDPTASN